jgi:hypothetical protein
MANASATKTKIQTSIQNEIDQNFELDLSTQCDSYIDASQNLDGITIVGSRDVAINQMNEALSLCQAKAVLDMELFQKLSAQAKQDIVKSVEQEGGIGINVSETNSEMLNEVKNKVGIDAYIDMSKKCLQEVDASQNISNVRIEDAQNIDISQSNKAFNKCLFDDKASISQKYDLDLDVGQKLDLKESQKGWDIIGSFFTGLGNLIIIPIAVCGLILILSCVGSSYAMTTSGGGEESLDMNAMSAMAGEAGMPIQMGGMIVKYLTKNKKITKYLLLIAIIASAHWLFFRKPTLNIKEKFHRKPLENRRLDRPLALRHEYHFPHLRETTYPRNYPIGEVPEYVKRWY